MDLAESEKARDDHGGLASFPLACILFCSIILACFVNSSIHEYTRHVGIVFQVVASLVYVLSARYYYIYL